MDPVTGTFTSMDTYAGILSDPMSLHKYLFANSNPVMYSDPSGLFSLADIDASMAIDCILNAGYMSGYLYIIDASITDPQLVHHDFTGYLCAIGFGMLFAALNLALSATVAGLLILAIIDTVLGVAGTIKGVIDFINGHKIYGGLEILSSVLLTWFGWRNFASAVNAASAVRNKPLTAEKNSGGSKTASSQNNPYMSGSDGEAELARLVGGKSHAYRKTSLGARFIDQLSPDNIAHESKVGYTTLTRFVKKQILKDAELIENGTINGAIWHFFKSGVTGKGGASQPLLRFLTKHGIKYIIH